MLAGTHYTEVGSRDPSEGLEDTEDMTLHGDNGDPGSWLFLFFHPWFMTQIDYYCTSSLLLPSGTTLRHPERWQRTGASKAEPK